MKFSFKSEIADDRILKRGFTGSRQRIIAVDPISPEVLFDFGQKIKTAAISPAKIETRVHFRKMHIKENGLHINLVKNYL